MNSTSHVKSGSTLTAAAQSTAAASFDRQSTFLVCVRGTFTGTVQLQYQFPGETAWTNADTGAFTGPTAQACECPDGSLQWQLVALAGFSGSADCRLSQ